VPDLSLPLPFDLKKGVCIFATLMPFVPDTPASQVNVLTVGVSNMPLLRRPNYDTVGCDTVSTSNVQRQNVVSYP